MCTKARAVIGYKCPVMRAFHWSDSNYGSDSKRLWFVGAAAYRLGVRCSNYNALCQESKKWNLPPYDSLMRGSERNESLIPVIAVR